jgi:hypothetical protein
LPCHDGALPLHRALSSLKFAAYSPFARICFPTEHLTDRVEHVAQKKLLDLFNKRTPVQLLCHLSPQACCTATMTSFSSAAGGMSWPLDSFLDSIRLEEDVEQFPIGKRLNGNIMSQQELLEDIHAVISIAPMALAIRSRGLGLYPFCLPLLQVPTTRSESRLKPASAEGYENRKRFTLSLAYDCCSQILLCYSDISRMTFLRAVSRDDSGDDDEQGMEQPRGCAHQPTLTLSPRWMHETLPLRPPPPQQKEEEGKSLGGL